MTRSAKLLPPIHPGEILREDFMKPLGLSMNRLALDLRVPVTRIAEIVHERRAISPDKQYDRYEDCDCKNSREELKEINLSGILRMLK